MKELVYEEIINKERLLMQTKASVLVPISLEQYKKTDIDRVNEKKVVKQWREEQRFKNPKWTKKSHLYAKPTIIS